MEELRKTTTISAMVQVSGLDFNTETPKYKKEFKELYTMFCLTRYSHPTWKIHGRLKNSL
jgi:hypothetical protein